MTGNINELFSIVVGKPNSFSFNLDARYYHEYMNIYIPVDRKILDCTQENNNLRA